MYKYYSFGISLPILRDDENAIVKLVLQPLYSVHFLQVNTDQLHVLAKDEARKHDIRELKLQTTQ